MIPTNAIRRQLQVYHKTGTIVPLVETSVSAVDRFLLLIYGKQPGTMLYIPDICS